VGRGRDHLRRGQDDDHRRRNRTSGPVLRSGCPRLVIQEAWAWLTSTQLARASAAAALRSRHAAARAQRRRNGAMVTADEEPFTASVRHAIRSMTTTQVTATSSLEALTAAADSAARACLHTLNLPGRQRHSERVQKARPKFAHTAAAKQTFTGKPQVTVFAPGFRLTSAPHLRPGGRKTIPRPVDPRAIPTATRGLKPRPHASRKQTPGNQRHIRTTTPQHGWNV
jgi:hypothetical protein